MCETVSVNLVVPSLHCWCLEPYKNVEKLRLFFLGLGANILSDVPTALRHTLVLVKDWSALPRTSNS